MQDNLYKLITQMEQDYTIGSTKLGKYVEFNQYENTEKITAYLYSKHISGDKDAFGRDKPFFNIVTSARNIWMRATDIDRKNITIKSTKKSEVIIAFLANIKVQEWMRKSNFGQFLNDWGMVLAGYGSAVTKFVEKGGELHREVVPWNRIICDQIDFDNNPVIERLYFTEAQLKNNPAYDQVKVEEICDLIQSRKLLDGSQVDNIAEYIELYEVHGVLPLSYITENPADEDTYVQQMHVVSIQKGTDGKDIPFTLVKGREKRSPYLITHLLKEEGRTQCIGAVEYLFDSQWMVNHSAKAMKDQLDLASKLIFQTADVNFVGRNVLKSIENGDILTHAPNAPLTQINNGSHDITSLQNFSTMWINNANSITSTPDAISGNTMPSGTAYRQVAVLNQEAHSLFELMTENKGFYIELMMREFVLPFVKKSLNTTDEISATLDDHYIKKIDSMYIPNEAIRRTNKKIKEQVLAGSIVSPYQQDLMIQSETQDLQKQLAQFGKQRFISPSDVSTQTWRDLFKDFEWEVEVETTNEQRDKEAILTTLTTVLQTLAINPSVLQDPNMKMLFNKIIANTGVVSEVELSNETQSNQSMKSSQQIPQMTT